jgi:hypothetical protein
MVVCIAVLMLALTLVLSACGGASLVGEWKDADGVIVEITEDQFIAEGVALDYVIKDGKIEMSLMGQTITLDYTLDGDTLTVTDPESGEPETLTRVK